MPVLSLVLSAAACSTADPPAATTSTTTLAPSAAPIAAAVRADPADPKRRLAIALVRRAGGDLTESRAGDALPAEQRRAWDEESKTACERSDPLACTLHGALVDSGGGDKAPAAAAFLRGCTGGDMLACGRLSQFWSCFHAESRIRYKTDCPDDLKSDLVARSPDPGAPTAGIDGARALGQKACDAGEPVGCVAAGMALEEAKEDRKHAFPLYERACDLGSYQGCERAVHGARQSLDDDKAAQAARRKYGEKALPMLFPGCEAKNEAICEQIAAFYEGGWGVPADMPQAKAYHLKACALGAKDACARAKLFK